MNCPLKWAANLLKFLILAIKKNTFFKIFKEWETSAYFSLCFRICLRKA